MKICRPILVAIAVMVGLAPQLAGAQSPNPARMVVRNATIIAFDEAGGSTTHPERALVIEGGLIVAIKSYEEDDLRPGDGLVDARGMWVMAGLIASAEVAPERYSEIARLPLRGVTTLAAPFGPTRLRWFDRVAKTASLPLPSLVDCAVEKRPSRAHIPSLGDQPTATEIVRHLVGRTRGEAKRLGLNDRGDVSIGLRGDLLILDKDPRVSPQSVEEPIEMLVGGVVLRQSGLQTHRAMTAEADQAMASRPVSPAGHRRFEIESSGLRLGHLTLSRNSDAGVEWWGPPLQQTTTWQWKNGDAAAREEPSAPKPGVSKSADKSSAWSLSLTQEVSNGFRIAIAIERGESSTTARAQLVSPEVLPATETTIEALPVEPLLDPISLASRRGEALLRLKTGESVEFEVIEPVPTSGTVKVGVRTIRFTRLAQLACPVPVYGDKLPFTIESLHPVGDGRSTPEAASGRPGADVMGWVITDPTGQPVRASLVAPEGVTEYFVSLPQPDPNPRPETGLP
jgi:hypothetical protein